MNVYLQDGSPTIAKKLVELNEDDNQKPVTKSDNTPVTSDSKNVDLDTRY